MLRLDDGQEDLAAAEPSFFQEIVKEYWFFCRERTLTLRLARSILDVRGQ
jgi:hypothetical protein